MKILHRCKRYDTAGCGEIASHDPHSYSNNCVSIRDLHVASDGSLILSNNAYGRVATLADSIEAMSMKSAQLWLVDTDAYLDEDGKK